MNDPMAPQNPQAGWLRLGEVINGVYQRTNILLSEGRARTLLMKAQCYAQDDLRDSRYQVFPPNSVDGVIHALLNPNA